jgi:hypothetical protein
MLSWLTSALHAMCTALKFMSQKKILKAVRLGTTQKNIYGSKNLAGSHPSASVMVSSHMQVMFGLWGLYFMKFFHTQGRLTAACHRAK